MNLGWETNPLPFLEIHTLHQHIEGSEKSAVKNSISLQWILVSPHLYDQRILFWKFLCNSLQNRLSREHILGND